MPEVINNSLFEVKLFADYSGQTCLSRFWYLQSVAPETTLASEVATNFEAHIQAELRAVTNSLYIPQVIEVIEQTSLVNFVNRASAIGPGILAGSPVASFVAQSIRLFRTTRETRSGWKRLPGLVEEQVNGQSIAPAHVTALQALADKFDGGITVTTGTLLPCLIRKKIDVVTGELTIASLWTYNLISDAQAVSRLTTQNTRKSWSGI